MSYGRGNKYADRKNTGAPHGRDGEKKDGGFNAGGEIIYGRNSVLEALKAGRSVNKLLFCGDMTGSLGQIISEAKDRGIVVTKSSRDNLDKLTGGANHQGVLIYVASADYADVDDIFKVAEERGEDPFIIILDEIQDAGNLGAIIRTADAVGAHGIIIPKRRSVPLTAAVAKASSGAVSYVKVARVPNLPAEIENLKKRGLWILGTDLTGTVKFYDADFKGPVGVVIGSEGYGMGRLVRESCDVVLTIPMAGGVTSLNASVAAGVVLYEAFKQRRCVNK